MAKEGVYARVCPVCMQEWCVVILPMLTANGLKIGWLKREEHLRILAAVKDKRTMAELEGEFGALKADLADEIVRVAAITESERLSDEEVMIEFVRERNVKRRTRSVKPVEVKGAEVWENEERDLNTILAQMQVNKAAGTVG